MKLTIKRSRDHKTDYILILFIALWSSEIMLPLALEVIKRIPIVEYASGVIAITFWTVIILLAAYYILRRLRYRDVLFYVLVALIVFIQMLTINQYTAQLENKWISILFSCLPYYFVGVALNIDALCDTKSNSYRLLLWMSYANLIVDVMYFVFYSAGIVSDNTYVDALNTNIRYTSFMFFAYATLPHLMFVFYDYLNARRKASLIISIVGLLVILAQGTRGAVLCFAVFAAITLMVRFAHIKVVYKMLIIAITFAFAIVFATTDILSNVANFLQAIMYKLGFSTRVLDSFLNADYIGDSGRLDLFKLAANAMKDAPVFGYGLTGDETILGVYSHNLFLELWLEFGLLLATGMIAAIVILIYKGYRKAACHSSISASFFALFLVLGFVKLLVSGTYLTEKWFFFLIGLSIQLIRRKCLTRNTSLNTERNSE